MTCGTCGPVANMKKPHLSNCQVKVAVHSCDSLSSIALTDYAIAYGEDRCFYCRTMGAIHTAKWLFMHLSCLSEGFDAESFSPFTFLLLFLGMSLRCLWKLTRHSSFQKVNLNFTHITHVWSTNNDSLQHREHSDLENLMACVYLIFRFYFWPSEIICIGMRLHSLTFLTNRTYSIKTFLNLVSWMAIMVPVEVHFLLKMNVSFIIYKKVKNW